MPSRSFKTKSRYIVNQAYVKKVRIRQISAHVPVDHTICSLLKVSSSTRAAKGYGMSFLSVEWYRRGRWACDIVDRKLGGVSRGGGGKGEGGVGV